TMRATVSLSTASTSRRAMRSGMAPAYWAGTRMLMLPGSTTRAVPSPRSVLTACATCDALTKSGSRSASVTVSLAAIVTPLPVCRHEHGGDVRDDDSARRHRDAETLEHVHERRRREDRLLLVAGLVQADDETVADERRGRDALERGDVFQARGLG